MWQVFSFTTSKLDVVRTKGIEKDLAYLYERLIIVLSFVFYFDFLYKDRTCEEHLHAVIDLLEYY